MVNTKGNCTDCIHEVMCKYSDRYKAAIKELENDIPEDSVLHVDVSCEYFDSVQLTRSY